MYTHIHKHTYTHTYTHTHTHTHTHSALSILFFKMLSVHVPFLINKTCLPPCPRPFLWGTSILIQAWLLSSLKFVSSHSEKERDPPPRRHMDRSASPFWE